MRIPHGQRLRLRHTHPPSHSPPGPHRRRRARPEPRFTTAAAQLEAVVRQPGSQHRGDGRPPRTVATRGCGEVVAGEEHRLTTLRTPVLGAVPRVLDTPAARHANVVDLVDGRGVPAHAPHGIRPPHPAPTLFPREQRFPPVAATVTKVARDRASPAGSTGRQPPCPFFLLRERLGAADRTNSLSPVRPSVQHGEIAPGAVTRGNARNQPDAVGKHRSPPGGQPSGRWVSTTARRGFVVKNGP